MSMEPPSVTTTPSASQPRKLRIVRKNQQARTSKETATTPVQPPPKKSDDDHVQELTDGMGKLTIKDGNVATPQKEEKEEVDRKAEREKKTAERQKEKEEITEKAATGCRGIELTFKKEEEKEVMERKLLLKLKPYRNHGFRVNWVSSTVAVVLFRTYFYGILILFYLLCSLLLLLFKANDAMERLKCEEEYSMRFADESDNEDTLAYIKAEESRNERRPYATSTNVARKLIFAHLGIKEQAKPAEGSVEDSVEKQMSRHKK